MILGAFDDYAFMNPSSVNTSNVHTFMIENAEFLRMRNTMVQSYNIDPTVAAYALLKVDCRGVDAAMGFIFDRGEDADSEPGKMQHPFVTYKPKQDNL